MKKDRIVLVCGSGSTGIAGIVKSIIEERAHITTKIVNDADKFSSVLNPKVIPVINYLPDEQLYQPSLTRAQRRAKNRKKS